MSHKRKRPLNTYGKKQPNKPFLLPSPSPPPSTSMSWYPDTNQTDFSQKPPLPPKKPTSQMAASMPAQPDEEKVQTLMEFCNGLDREQAIRYLKAKRNDIEQAVNAFYSGEDISKEEQATQWDESIMSADRDGEKDDAWGSRLAPLGAASAAATRPNSPAPSHRSNLHPRSQAEADADIARALAESSAGIDGQETGVIGPAGQTPYFGPANKDHNYDTGQWAMVPRSSMAEATEVVPDLGVEQRVLVPGEPRTLKHLPGGDYTPNLLTICGTIDMVRESMMRVPSGLEDYGQDPEWWRGHPIAQPKIVHLDGTAAEPEADRCDELLAETQRLMAFLTASERSYGNVGALTQTDMIKNTSPSTTRSRTLLELFMQSWCIAASTKQGEEADFTRLFNTTVGTNAPEGMDTADMGLIDMQVVIGEGEKADLFEVLDGLLWETDADSTTMSDNYIEVPAELLVMRVHQANPSVAPVLRMEVPADFYVDKYLKENISATRSTRLEMAKGKKRISKIEEIEKKLKMWKHPKKNEQIDAGLLLKHTLGHFNGENKRKAAKNDRTYISTGDEVNEEPPHYQEIAEKLERLVLNIESKLQVLADEKEKTRKTIADLSKAPPPGLDAEDLKHRYTLRGVATKPNITYILCPINDETKNESIDDEKTPPGMRWWRLEYHDSSPPHLTKNQVGDFDVLRAVELEHHSALLVYASDVLTSPSWNPTPLPGPLQTFIDRDNALFTAELQAAKSREINNAPTYTASFDMTDVPRESIERNSMDSTRVEGGSSDDGLEIDGEKLPPAYESEGFYDRSGFGLPPGGKDDGEVHEIRLDEEDEGVGMGTEMVEKKRSGIFGGGDDVDAGMG